MKIHPVGAELLHADRRTDIRTDSLDEPIVTFSSFANAPKNLFPILHSLTDLCNGD